MKNSFVAQSKSRVALSLLLLAVCGPAGAQLILDPSNFTSADVGNPILAGSATPVAGGYTITGGGLDLGGTNDQFRFHYQLVEGDFDVAVRLESVSLADAWSKAGLMARETLTGGSPHASALTTPGASGSFFQFRALQARQTTNQGFFPATYPNTWVRLKRAGNTFSGYASLNGTTWTPLGAHTGTSAPPATLHLGLVVGSRNSNQLATAQFRGLNNITDTPPLGSLSLAALGREPIGPSTRRGAFVISEIMYHPRKVPADTNRSLEFVEIYNAQVYPENLGNHYLSGSIEFKFPPNFLMQAGQFVVVARDPAFVESHYGITGVLGPWTGAATNGLPGDEGLVRLRNPAGAVLLEVPYQGANPWPIAADGSGHSLVLNRPSYGERDAKAWAASTWIDGSPGRDEPYGSDRLRPVVINEIQAHTDDFLENYVELYNHSSQPVDVSGAWLSDVPDQFRYQIPANRTIPAGGFLNINESELGFVLRAAGHRIYLFDPARTRVVDVVEYVSQYSGQSSGRSPDGADGFSVLLFRTPGEPNTGISLPPIVINEIMYNPITGDNNDEFIELYNRTGSIQDLSGWRLRGGISFNFPSNTFVPPNGYLVVAENRTNLLAHYPNLNSTNTVGDYDGSLGNGGERISLLQPEIVVYYDAPTSTLLTNRNFVPINEVTYSDGGRWGDWSDGGGSSLELKDPESDNRQPANWGDSDETSKPPAPWTTIEVTGNLGAPGPGPSAPDKLIVSLLGVGECLVDDVEVRNAAGANIAPNGGLESGLTNWTLQGSHDHSSLQDTGASGNRSLHIRAASRGDNGANRTRVGPLVGLTVTSTNVTLRAKVRWIRGWPELLLRLQGGGLECSGRMNVPLTLGTPGERNTRRIDNAGPAIYEVSHSPALPAAQEQVVVTARASDPHGLSALVLNYRLDATLPGAFTPLNMLDDGLAPDDVAGDGIYSALLSGRPAGAAVSFYLEATDALGATNRFPHNVFPPAGLPRCFPSDALTKECLVRWGDRQLSGSIPTYHLWCTLANIGRWDSRFELNNAPLDGTFVYNNYRVVYNSRPQFAGSPWHQGAMSGGPTNNNARVDYVCNFPEDDLFLGATDTVLATCGNPDGNHGTDTSAQTEQTSYIFFREMGLQYNYRRWIRLFVNGNERSDSDDPGIGLANSWVMEDSQQPNSDTVDEWFPDDNDGDLYKIEDWFEFNPDGSKDGNDDADLGRRQTVINGRSVLNTAPYRFMWRKRALDSGKSASDYRTIFEVIDTVSPTLTYSASSSLPIPDPAALETLADVEQWMRIFAVQHAVGNWDAYGYDRGKNAYTYKPTAGRFVQWTWDIDFTMGVGGHDAGASLFSVSDGRVAGMWATPVFRRMYLRAFEDLVTGPWNSAYMNPILDAKAAALTAHGVRYVPSTLSTIKSYITARRTTILGELNRANTSWSVRPPTNSFPTNLLVLSGSAPIGMRDIYVNGVNYPVTWTSVTNWTLRLLLEPGTNSFTLRGYKPNGTAATNLPITVTAVYDGTVADPLGSIVFNEIMYHPTAPEASYVELFNRSKSAFDLSGWRVNGIDYEFPPNSIIRPGEYLVLAKNRSAMLVAYPGSTTFGQFSGNLDQDGETLTLIKPGASAGPDVVIDKVRYEHRLPWSLAANGSGAALQLVDSTQDNSRPSNWADREGWRFVTFTTNMAANTDTNLFIWLRNPGGVYVDDIVLVTGVVANVGQNLLLNGDFESALSGPWLTLSNHSNSFISTQIKHSGNASLFVTNAGGVGTNVACVRQRVGPFPAATRCTLSFWMLPTTETNFLTVTFRVTAPAAGSVNRIAQNLASPSAPNTVADTLPPYDELWLNELQADNLSGPADNQGERDPWIELFNPGDTPVNLSGYFLANNYDTNLTQWPFPEGASLGPKQFMILWADGQPGQTVAGLHWHTSFRLNSTTGTVALVRLVDNTPQITDYLTYSQLPPDRTYGDYPDGQPFHRQILFDVSPGEGNVGRYVDIRINEWMAANSGSVSDPADPAGEGFDDWFELYNAGGAPVDLGGFFLTDHPDDPRDYFAIPANGQYVIPPGGYLLVWADNQTEQNSSARPDLHVPFQLSRGGETIALFGIDGRTLIDRVEFGTQEDNITQGRFPDGSLAVSELSIPTPRSANVGNSPPQLDPIPNQTVRLGQTARFTATATDPEQPPQTLTFSLVPTIPAGAQIDPETGQFTWTPNASQAPRDYDIAVRVTDNGVPARSSTRTLIVSVLLGPKSSITRTAPDQVTLVFDTTPGRKFQVQFKRNLGDAEWVDLQPAHVATGTTLSITDSPISEPQRFYRILQLD